jgi:hypothetical protein
LRDANTNTYGYSYFNSAAYSHTKTESDTQRAPNAASETVR